MPEGVGATLLFWVHGHEGAGRSFAGWRGDQDLMRGL